MKSKNPALLCTIILTVSIVSFVHAQTIGKIYTKAAADSIYGKVTYSVKISTADLKSYTLKTSNYIMFNIVQGKAVILNNNRSALTPNAAVISSNEVFKVCSVSVLLKLLQLGNSPETYLEERPNVLTITDGNFTVEQMANCPPICP